MIYVHYSTLQNLTGPMITQQNRTHTAQHTILNIYMGVLKNKHNYYYVPNTNPPEHTVPNRTSHYLTPHNITYLFKLDTYFICVQYITGQYKTKHYNTL